MYESLLKEIFYQTVCRQPGFEKTSFPDRYKYNK
jgi:hypothetical protein